MDPWKTLIVSDSHAHSPLLIAFGSRGGLHGKVSQTPNMCVADTYTIFQSRDLASHALFNCDFREDVVDYF